MSIAIGTPLKTFQKNHSKIVVFQSLRASGAAQCRLLSTLASVPLGRRWMSSWTSWLRLADKGANEND